MDSNRNAASESSTLAIANRIVAAEREVHRINRETPDNDYMITLENYLAGNHPELRRVLERYDSSRLTFLYYDSDADRDASLPNLLRSLPPGLNISALNGLDRNDRISRRDRLSTMLNDYGGYRPFSDDDVQRLSQGGPSHRDRSRSPLNRGNGQER